MAGVPRDGSTALDRIAKNSDPNENSDFTLIKCVGRFVIDILMKCWLLSGTALLAIFLVYWIYGGWLAFALLCFAATGVFYRASDFFLFHPEQPANSRLYVASPALLGLPFDNLFLKTKDGVKLNALFLKQHGEVLSKAPTVLFLHGNAGNIGHRLVNAKGLYQDSGCNVFMLEYRGYGHSEGTPSEEGFYLDAQSALDYLWTRTDIDRTKIVVFGRSLGGAVAIDLAFKTQRSGRIMALMVENSFTSIPDTARILFSAKPIRWLPNWCYKNQFLSKQKLTKVVVPTLFISGLSDWLIPPWMMQGLYDASKSPMKRIARFESGTHNDTYNCAGYYEVLNLFLDDVMFARADEGHLLKATHHVVHDIPLDIL